MHINIADELVEKLKKYQDSRIVLDLDDGVGRYSKSGSCALNISFRLLILDKDQDDSDYTLDVESTIGNIPIKEHSKLYLEEEMSLTFDPRMSLIKLKGPSGIIDGNVQIIDLRKKE
ncbi:iron-sulfur cluster biosynthesis family protein [Enterococcus dongliensis]|uniref:Iron-sulfur cluster biosynthesis family protein n=1 Tax=Enterococcus dongliensis TaxID=2559925 RepID=A0AAP5KQG5_9ENTE|nr:iron-sulfur cluster biosynthesis family protein [Enterococcus dongliensis]MDT2596625.1 iron-sulfur cluster biosynthesis family protein [Enterococcus dongliensis]MDT2603684.1 iron-sulfur cluster biosynthesis family protein [Enterococcus dongliensis]MDT2612638.1 iron-sulfur cluster biosynthesis family protein [Enterococcus dongliensis]MDT2634389.1 iron-sulfur cluster biosynthesis family protein [Enterococcus dongliensis]MDT2637419.1 iron-sulfur cluster biosynthesis family protein [Enterococcu